MCRVDLAEFLLAFGWLDPVQEVIDVAVILNALRALTPALGRGGPRITAEQGLILHHDHQTCSRTSTACARSSMRWTMRRPSPPRR